MREPFSLARTDDSASHAGRNPAWPSITAIGPVDADPVKAAAELATRMVADATGSPHAPTARRVGTGVLLEGTPLRR